MILHAIGIDMAFANVGLAHVVIDINPLASVAAITVQDLMLISTEGQDRKVVRKSSDDLRRAIEIKTRLVDFCNQRPSQFAFVEVPTGSQSASAARSLGIAVGVLASCPLPIIEVSPMEVKEAVSGSRKVKATKADIIKWAVGQWPTAPWLREKKSGRVLNSNEHLADALAAIKAGIRTPEFQRLITMHHATTSTHSIGPAPGRRRLL